MTGLDNQRVIRVRVAPIGGEGFPWGFGTAYLVSPRRALTAAHVLLPPNRDGPPEKGQRCELLRWPWRDQSTWAPSSVVWSDSIADLAVLEIESDATVDCATFRRLEGSDVFEWRTVGFPDAGIDATARESEAVYGTLSPAGLAELGLFALKITSREPHTTAGAPTGWEGCRARRSTVESTSWVLSPQSQVPGTAAFRQGAFRPHGPYPGSLMRSASQRRTSVPRPTWTMWFARRSTTPAGRWVIACRLRWPFGATETSCGRT